MENALQILIHPYRDPRPTLFYHPPLLDHQLLVRVREPGPLRLPPLVVGRDRRVAAFHRQDGVDRLGPLVLVHLRVGLVERRARLEGLLPAHGLDGVLDDFLPPVHLVPRLIRVVVVVVIVVVVVGVERHDADAATPTTDPGLAHGRLLVVVAAAAAADDDDFGYLVPERRGPLRHPPPARLQSVDGLDRQSRDDGDGRVQAPLDGEGAQQQLERVLPAALQHEHLAAAPLVLDEVVALAGAAPVLPLQLGVGDEGVGFVAGQLVQVGEVLEDVADLGLVAEVVRGGALDLEALAVLVGGLGVQAGAAEGVGEVEAGLERLLDDAGDVRGLAAAHVAQDGDGLVPAAQGLEGGDVVLHVAQRHGAAGAEAGAVLVQHALEAAAEGDHVVVPPQAQAREARELQRPLAVGVVQQVGGQVHVGDLGAGLAVAAALRQAHGDVVVDGGLLLVAEDGHLLVPVAGDAVRRLGLLVLVLVDQHAREVALRLDGRDVPLAPALDERRHQLAEQLLALGPAARVVVDLAQLDHGVHAEVAPRPGEERPAERPARGRRRRLAGRPVAVLAQQAFGQVRQLLGLGHVAEVLTAHEGVAEQQDGAHEVEGLVLARREALEQQLGHAEVVLGGDPVLRGLVAVRVADAEQGEPLGEGPQAPGLVQGQVADLQGHAPLAAQLQQLGDAQEGEDRGLVGVAAHRPPSRGLDGAHGGWLGVGWLTAVGVSLWGDCRAFVVVVVIVVVVVVVYVEVARRVSQEKQMGEECD
ncbi:chromosome segregation protein SMC [Colletotrichum higginsianum]|nr:chromosome segregation protein SMC [Colletotrichum higginsianum]